ncbi:Hsp33 family molecular chaperone HslO [Gracilinema caldarium]|uniref:Hsp33 family molecular chaperone HslO n=1 Tax=Gracilinema caldarium TaxID=215591 RepID=UPI0026EA0246|nr:Hsp33 family molecular chaperone HslO [Gracilinema caldarium]
MIIAPISDPVTKDHLNNISPDGITRFTMLQGTIKGALVSGTRLVAQARANHDLGIIESLALGQALLSAALLSTTIKEGTKLTLQVSCSGPLKGFSAETTWDGKVRGYLYNDTVKIDKPLESFDLKPFIGSGTLSVIRNDGRGEPYTGHIELVHGRIAEDLTEYFLRSEQTKTALAVSVRFDKEGRVSGAGGLFFQALPGAQDLDMEDTEDRMREMPSLGTWFASGKSRQNLLDEWFQAFELDHIHEDPVQFYCDCSRDRFLQFLAAMQRGELEQMLATGPWPMEIHCHNCGSRYQFARDEIAALIQRNA